MTKRIIKRSLSIIMICVQIFANSCNNSSIDTSISAKGDISWKSYLFSSENGDEKTGYLLSSGDKIFIVSNKSITAFNTNGKLLWNRKIWPFSPVSLRFNKIFFISDEQYSRMNAIDLDNNIVINDFWIPELIDQSYLTLFEPVEKGLIAQVQYRPDPDEGEMGFVVYRIHSDGLGTEWQKNYDAQKSKVIPVVLPEKNLLITSNMSDVFEFNLMNQQQDPNPVSKFPLPLGKNTIWLSADKNDKLFWLGNVQDVTKLSVTGLNGNLLWEWTSEPEMFDRDAIPLAPAITGKSLTYILTDHNFFAVSNGKTLWKLNSEDSSFIQATALNDDTVLLTQPYSLKHLDSNGAVIFEIKFEEQLVSAPVVDKDGKIYVAGTDSLFCIE